MGTAFISHRPTKIGRIISVDSENFLIVGRSLGRVNKRPPWLGFVRHTIYDKSLPDTRAAQTPLPSAIPFASTTGPFPSNSPEEPEPGSSVGLILASLSDFGASQTFPSPMSPSISGFGFDASETTLQSGSSSEIKDAQTSLSPISWTDNGGEQTSSYPSSASAP